MKTLLLWMYKLIRRELLVSLRTPHMILHPLLFFGITLILFPLALTSSPTMLHTLAPGIVWIVALLAHILSMERFFEQDEAEGILECWLIYPVPLTVIVYAKIITHWLLTGFLLALMVPVVGIMLSMRASEIAILSVSLFIGTPILSCLGALGAAITISLPLRGVLLSLLLFPLWIPVLILGTGSVTVFMSGLSCHAWLALLAAMASITWVGVPPLAACALRVSQE